MTALGELLDLIRAFARPFLLVSALCLLSNPGAAIRKLKLFHTTVQFLALSKDKKFEISASDPASFFTKELGGSAASKPAGVKSYAEKTVIMIRHGESTWNDTFNAGDRNKLLFVAFFVPNLLYALFLESYFFVAGKDFESWFYDSALSAKGVRQGEGLRRHLQRETKRIGTGGVRKGAGATSREDEAVSLLLALGETSSPSSMVVSSNLRRAMSTAAIGLADRFVATAVKGDAARSGGDQILLLPSLQEISKNPDALTILPPKGTAHPTWCDDGISGLPPGTFTGLIDSRHHGGNKDITSNGLIRLNQFCNDVFDASLLPKDCVVATGHSLFFRSMFQVYLPRGTAHVSKKKKLVNGGTVMVTLREATMEGGRKEYMIDPGSVVMVYGGFGKHTKG